MSDLRKYEGGITVTVGGVKLEGVKSFTVTQSDGEHTEPLADEAAYLTRALFNKELRQEAATVAERNEQTVFLPNPPKGDPYAAGRTADYVLDRMWERSQQVKGEMHCPDCNLHIPHMVLPRCPHTAPNGATCWSTIRAMPVDQRLWDIRVRCSGQAHDLADECERLNQAGYPADIDTWEWEGEPGKLDHSLEPQQFEHGPWGPPAPARYEPFGWGGGGGAGQNEAGGTAHRVPDEEPSVDFVGLMVKEMMTAESSNLLYIGTDRLQALEERSPLKPGDRVEVLEVPEHTTAKIGEVGEVEEVLAAPNDGAPGLYNVLIYDERRNGEFRVWCFRGTQLGRL